MTLSFTTLAKRTLMLCAALFGIVAVQAVRIVDLRCEMMSNPWGVVSATPALSWKIPADHNGIQQKAYQILAASTPEKVNEKDADLWNSGKVESEDQVWVHYAGKKLSSRSVVYWKLRVWDEKGAVSDWSATGRFSVGILSAAEWNAKYIGMARQDTTANPMLRKKFMYSKKYSAAFLHISTLGYHEVYINGKKVNADVLVPAVMEWPKRSLSMSYNISSLLKEGENDVVIWLGKGWYNASSRGIIGKGPYTMAEIDALDGNKWKTIAATDKTWQARQSGYYSPGNWYKCDFNGEVVKANEVLPDLTTATLDQAKWEQAIEANIPERLITPMTCEPNRIQAEIRPVKISRFNDTHNGTWMIDMGKSVVGWTKIKFGKLQKGQKISISYCDMLGTDGDFASKAFTDTYIASGNDNEEFCNKFNYHAYRYIKIDNLGYTPQLEDFTGMLIHTGYENKSSFTCSDPDMNAIHDMIHYTFPCLSLGGYIVDCPHLERKGYGGDGNASLVSAQTMYDLYPLYSNWIQAYEDAEEDDGGVPHTGPMYSPCGGGPYWCMFVATAPWQTYVQYGDKSLLERYWPKMEKYLEYVDKNLSDGMLLLQNRWPNTNYRHWYLGDWALPNEEHQRDEASIDDVNNCALSWYYDTMSKIAKVIGKDDKIDFYAKKRDDLNKKIQQKCFHANDNSYGIGTQIDLCYPMLVGATPQNLIPKVENTLKTFTHDKYNDHLFTGLVGITILTQWLTKSGDADFMYKMLKQHSYPGYLYMIDNGATTTWEHWEATRSRIHNCYNGIGSWFYQALAGITPDENAPGYKHFNIKPQPAEGIDYVRCSKNTPYGSIKIEWNKMGDVFDIKAEIPEGTTASVEVPFTAKSAEIPPTGLVRYGLVYNEKMRDKVAEVPSTKYDPSKPIELKSGKYRIIYHLK